MKHLWVTCADCVQGPFMLQYFLQHPESHSSLPILGGMSATSSQEGGGEAMHQAHAENACSGLQRKSFVDLAVARSYT